MTGSHRGDRTESTRAGPRVTAGTDPTAEPDRAAEDSDVAAPAALDARLAAGAGAAWAATFACLQLAPDSALPAAVIAGVVALCALALDWFVPAGGGVDRKQAGRSPAIHDDTRSVVGAGASRPNRASPRPRRRAGRRAGLRSGLRRRSAGVALAGFCCCGTLFSLGAHVAQLRSGPIRALVQRSAAGVFEVTVTGDPRPIVSTQSFGGARVALDATLTRARSGPRRYVMHIGVVVVASAETWSAIIPGEQLRIDGRLTAPRLGQFVGADISARGAPIVLRRAPWWQRAAAGVRKDLRTAAAVLPADERGLLPGLVDGDTSTLDPQLSQAFKTAGLTHLVAVSGTNAAVLIGAVLLVLRRFRTPPWACAVIGGVVLIAFVAVARASPSVVRAGVMAGVLLVALATGRPRQGLPSLALAVLVLLMWHPDWAGSAGFALSALATGSLFLMAPGWADALRRRHVPPVIAEGLAVSGAATIVSAPIIVLLSGRLSLVALPANVLAEIAVAPATVLGVLAAATAPWSAFLGAAFARAAGVPCRWLISDARWFSSLPGATVSWPATVAGATALVLALGVVAVLLKCRATRRPLAAAAVTAMVIEAASRSMFGAWTPGDTIFVACDVGQGDGVVLPVGHHAAVVMDSGPEPEAIDRCLSSLGVTSVPLYIQSHFDLDHVGGIPGVVDGRRVGRVITGPLQTPSLGRGLLTRALAPQHVTSQIVAPGAEIDVGPVHLHVLESHVVDVDGEPDSNNSSLIIRASVAGYTILLTGDASTEAQQALMSSGQSVTADVLKVPHHGSAYFDPAFLAAVHAKLAVISVGLHNTYGHPAPSLLKALAGLGVPVRRTDEDGDVAVLARGSRLEVVRHEPSARLAAAATGPAPTNPARRPAPPPAVGTTVKTAVGTAVGIVQASTSRADGSPRRAARRIELWPVSASRRQSKTTSSGPLRPAGRSPPRSPVPLTRTPELRREGAQAVRIGAPPRRRPSPAVPFP